MRERLVNILGRAGYGGRAGCEELLARGGIVVNGKVVREAGASADPDADRIEVVGERLRFPDAAHFVLNKPHGVGCATGFDPRRRTRATDLVPVADSRLFVVGKLDTESTGLVLLTNDGRLARRLDHPRSGLESVWRVELDGPADHSFIQSMQRGVFLPTGKATILRGRVLFSGKDRSMLEVTVREGRNREIWRIASKLGRKTRRLMRVRMGPVSLEGLKPGEHRPLTGAELEQLRSAARPEFDGLGGEGRPRGRKRRRGGGGGRETR